MDDTGGIEAARVALGRQLAELRRAAGYSQVQFAPLTGYGRSTLANVEIGRQNVPEGFWQRCDEALGAAGLLTAGYGQIQAMVTAERREAARRSEADREARVWTWRQLRQAETLRDPDVVGGPLISERLSYVLAHPGSVDLVSVAYLRERIRRLDERYDRAPSTALIAETGQCLGQVVFLGAHAERSHVRRDLYAAEAEVATLMGQLVWDASQRRDHDTALVYFDQAIAAARQIGDRRAEGLALLRKSFVALYGQHAPDAGLRLSQQTARTADGISDVVTGLGVLHAAEAHAMLGQRRSCEQALSTSDKRFGQIKPSDGAIDLFSPTQHGRLAGSCYLHLGDAKRAEPILEEAARTLQDQSKSQAIVLGNLSLACIRQRKLDAAVARLHEAIDVIELNWSGGGLNVVFGAGRELRPWRQDAGVQDVYDRLHSLIAA